jgi:transcriptional regulator with XRE-family HTH domain
MVKLRVKEVAEQQGLDIAKLARRADLAYATVYKAWHNKATGQGVGIYTLAAIAQALGVRVVDLIEEVEDVDWLAPALAADWTPQRESGLIEVAGAAFAVPALHP